MFFCESSCQVKTIFCVGNILLNPDLKFKPSLVKVVLNLYLKVNDVHRTHCAYSELVFAPYYNRRQPTLPQNRPLLALKCYPRLPSIKQSTWSQWPSRTHMVFLKQIMTALRRQKNLRDKLIRARVPIAHPQRERRGMYNCRMNYTECFYMKPGK